MDSPARGGRKHEAHRCGARTTASGFPVRRAAGRSPLRGRRNRPEAGLARGSGALAGRPTAPREGGSALDATALHRQLIVIDGCSWTLDGWTEKLAASGVTALNLTLAGETTDFHGALGNIETALHHIHGDPDHFLLARTAADIWRAKAAGRVAIVFNFQNGRPIEDSLLHLELFRELGVRNIQLTYNERNFIGDGCLEPSNAGLSLLGRRVVQAMNRLNLLIDLTHVGERTSLEAIDLSEYPCVFSHSNPRRRADNPRNITDEQIVACARRGGVIGACGWGPVCWTGGDAPPTVDDFIGHVEYLVDLAGVDHVAVATDSSSSTRIEHILQHAAEINAAYPTVTGGFVARFGTGVEHRYPVSLANLSAVTANLLARGWEPADVGKVMGGNFRRVWEQVWGA